MLGINLKKSKKNKSKLMNFYKKTPKKSNNLIKRSKFDHDCEDNNIIFLLVLKII